MLSPNTENYLYGKGQILFQRTGTTGLLHLGNVPDFGINAEVTKEEHYGSMTGTNAIDKTRIKQKAAKSTISLEELSAENINLAWLGDSIAETTQSASTLADEAVTTIAGKYVEIGSIALSDVVVKTAAEGDVLVVGTDYDIIPEAGLIREIEGGLIASNTAYVSATVPEKTLSGINALVSATTEGKLFFIGIPEDGPAMKVEGWKVALTISGEIKLISDGISAIPMEAEYLDDSANHPDNPFFLATIIS